MNRGDYFLAAALAGLCANPELISETAATIAGWALEQSDAVLDALDERAKEEAEPKP